MSDIDQTFRQAVEAQQAGRLREAIEGYRRVLEADPARYTALNNLGMVLHAAGKAEESLAPYQRVLASKDNPVTRNNLGNALRELGRREEAVEHYRRALTFKEDFADVHGNLGVTLAELGRIGEAVRHLERAVALKPEHAPAHNNLGNARQTQGRIAEALAHYRKAIELAPDYGEAHSNVAAALVSLGREAEAVTHFEQAVKLQPYLGGAQRQLAQLRPESIDVPAVEALIANPRLPDAHRLELYFTLGEVYRSRGDHERAFTAFDRANRLKRAHLSWDAGAHARQVDDIIRLFSREFFAAHGEAGAAAEEPVFIVGMPRSGTTLVEQILASHPAVGGGGEQPFIPMLARQAGPAGTPWPEAVAALDPARCIALGEEYLSRLRASVPADRQRAARLTDKLPDNFLRIGVIRRLLPRARIIHCRRDPRDTALSIYFHHFAAPHPYSWSLADIGSYYRDYLRLMAHWRGMLPPGRFLEIRYEDVVADLEGRARQLLAFLGLDWDPRCLEFHRTERFLISASNAEVRRPLYTTAVGRWRHYEKHLAPFTAALGDADG